MAQHGGDETRGVEPRRIPRAGHAFTAAQCPHVRPHEARCASWEAGFLDTLDEVQRLFHGRWTTTILVVLRDGPKHYTEIRDAIRALPATEGQCAEHHVLHDSVLARNLKVLVSHQLIYREETPGAFPPSVRYVLNPAAGEALVAWQHVVDWAREHGDLMAPVRHGRGESGTAA